VSEAPGRRSLGWRGLLAPARVMQAYVSSRAGDYAAGLAFNLFVAMFPIALGLLAVLGFVERSGPLHAGVEAVLLNAFPADAQRQVGQTLAGVRQNAWWLAAFSVLGLLWSGTTLFSSLEFALNSIHQTPSRPFLRSRLLGLRMMLVLFLAISVTVGLNWAIELDAAFAFLAPLGGFLIMFGLLLWIYRVVPNRRLGLRDVWPGALLAAVSIEVLALGFPIYVRLTHRLTTYGRGFGLIFVLVTWAYFLSQLVLLGAVLNRRRLDRVPALKEVPSLSVPQDADRRHVQA